jgi:integrase
MPHERRVFVTLTVIGVPLVVLAECSRTRPQRSGGATRETALPAAASCPGPAAAASSRRASRRLDPRVRSGARGEVMSELLVDRAGRGRSPATMPGFHAARPPRNKGLRSRPIHRGGGDHRRHAAAGDRPHGRRLRGLMVILWRAGLRIQEALPLAEADLDHHRGALRVRRGKGGRRREVGMDAWGWEELQPWLELRVHTARRSALLRHHRSYPRPTVVERRRPSGPSPDGPRRAAWAQCTVRLALLAGGIGGFVRAGRRAVADPPSAARRLRVAAPRLHLRAVAAVARRRLLTPRG